MPDQRDNKEKFLPGHEPLLPNKLSKCREPLRNLMEKRKRSKRK